MYFYVDHEMHIFSHSAAVQDDAVALAIDPENVSNTNLRVRCDEKQHTVLLKLSRCQNSPNSDLLVIISVKV